MPAWLINDNMLVLCGMCSLITCPKNMNVLRNVYVASVSFWSKIYGEGANRKYFPHVKMITPKQKPEKWEPSQTMRNIKVNIKSTTSGFDKLLEGFFSASSGFLPQSYARREEDGKALAHAGKMLLQFGCVVDKRKGTGSGVVINCRPATMFRNQYDNDVTVWSPQGRIHQIEYAMEAVKQGSAAVGLKSKTHAILVALKRAPSELSSHQKKILHIDNHVGVAIAGLTADARGLSKFMRTECMNSRYAYEKPLPVSRLVNMIANKSQIPTQRYGRRPFGVGLLVAGYDNKPHIYQTCPSANIYDCKAMAIGARSQSARTYLEKFFDTFPDCELEELIKHGLRALRDTLPSEVELTTKNCSLGIVGKDTDFTIYDDSNVEKYLKMIEGEERSSGAGKEDDAMDADGGGEGEAKPDADPQPAEPQVEDVQPMDQ